MPVIDDIELFHRLNDEWEDLKEIPWSESSEAQIARRKFLKEETRSLRTAFRDAGLLDLLWDYSSDDFNDC